MATEPVKLPVFSDRHGVAHIELYRQAEDGTFVRTSEQPFRALRDHIEGVSEPVGEVVIPEYDRRTRQWSTPTVVRSNGRGESYFQFLREQLARRRFFVCTAPEHRGRLGRLRLHELKIKASAPRRVMVLFSEKYVQALDLWSEAEKETLAPAASSVVNY